MDCILLDCKTLCMNTFKQALFLRYISITVNYFNSVFNENKTFKQALFLSYISITVNEFK